MLKMVTADDKALIKGSFINQSVADFNGLLTDGTLEVKGDFYQISGSSANFRASGNHTVLLSGNGKQTVKFTNSSSDQSGFNNLEITNDSEEGVVFDTTSSYPLAKGKVKDNGNKVTGALAIIGSTSFETNHYCSDLVVVERVTISNEIETDGNFSTGEQYELSLSGKITAGGDISIQTRYTYYYANIYAKGNMYIGGRTGNYMYVYMYDGSINVDGDLNINKVGSGSATRIYDYSNNNIVIPITVKGNLLLGDNAYCEVSKGILTLGGNLSGNGYLLLSGSHKTILNGEELQIIDINSSSYFNELEVTNSSNEGIYFKYLYPIKNLISNGNKIKYEGIEGVFGCTLEEDTTIGGDLILIDDTLDLNGHKLTITGNLIQYSGIVYVHGGELNVEGDYRIEKTKTVDGNTTYVVFTT